MSASVLEHPELVNGANPLLEAAAPYISFDKLPGKLKREPLKGCDWRSVDPARRASLLALGEQHYWPNRIVLDLADTIQSMLRGGLMARNPLSVAEQRRINNLAQADEVRQVPLQSLRVRAGGGIISAITGIGKSALLERTLDVVAPDQVVVHGRSEACGWSTLTQVLYLIIDAPSNGTRGGLLARIVAALDTLLGTDYYDTFRKLRNLDASLLFVTKLLSNHRVGLLAIDENQQDNFDECIWQRSFVLFFLGLMNLGIPVLLLGNPLAFTGLEAASQTMRRFSTSGYYKLAPAASPSEPWWARDHVPGMCQFLLCDEAPPIAEIIEATFGMSAGVPGLFGPIWFEAQRVALRRGGQHICMTRGDLMAATRSPRVTELLAMASQILGATKDQRFLDIPLGPSGKRNEVPPSTNVRVADGVDISSVDGEEASAQIASVMASFQKKAQAKRDKAAKNKGLIDSLSPEDLRAQTVQMEIFAGLQGMQEPLLPGGRKGLSKQR